MDISAWTRTSNLDIKIIRKIMEARKGEMEEGMTDEG